MLCNHLRGRLQQAAVLVSILWSDATIEFRQRDDQLIRSVQADDILSRIAAAVGIIYSLILG
jgi:hypothetical protein